MVVVPNPGLPVLRKFRPMRVSPAPMPAGKVAKAMDVQDNSLVLAGDASDLSFMPNGLFPL
jgi:hypothetical protein